MRDPRKWRFCRILCHNLRSKNRLIRYDLYILLETTQNTFLTPTESFIMRTQLRLLLAEMEAVEVITISEHGAHVVGGLRRGGLLLLLARHRLLADLLVHVLEACTLGFLAARRRGTVQRRRHVGVWLDDHLEAVELFFSRTQKAKGSVVSCCDADQRIRGRIGCQWGLGVRGGFRSFLLCCLWCLGFCLIW